MVNENRPGSGPLGLASVVAVAVVVVLWVLSDGAPALAQDAPTVTGVHVTSQAYESDTFGPGDRVWAHVYFSEPVAVTGRPRLVLRIGDQDRYADASEAGWGARAQLRFRYFVQASDHDDDGISIPANAVRLNGGSIRSAGLGDSGVAGIDADLTHEAVPAEPGAKVDGGLDAVPTITRVNRSRPWRGGDTFGRGDLIHVSVEFSEGVALAGNVQIALQVGEQTRRADLHIRSHNFAQFYYHVHASDVDTDGFSVPADALILNGGSIKDVDGNDADLTHDALPDDPDHKVDGMLGAVPTVRYVSFPSASAPKQEVYTAGETIIATVQFQRNVRVTGTPQITLQVGAQERRADYMPRRRLAELLPPSHGFHLPGEGGFYLGFGYVVQPSDVDDDGVSIPANSLILNGGSIRGEGDGTDADLSHDAASGGYQRRVDGGRSDDEAPTVHQGFVDRPLSGMFRRGDAITLFLTMSEAVTVTGSPRVALGIGAATRYAAFREIWDSNWLVFDYVVQESDYDADGLSMAADAFELNGGTIRDNSGNDADLVLGHRAAFDNDPNLKVDGGLTPVPALPLGGALALALVLLVGGRRRLARQRANCR